MTQQEFQHSHSQLTGKFLADYVYGNEKIETAIKHAVCWIPVSSKRILDIGCGIGWSSWEFKKRCPRASVFALDPNESLIRTAGILFSQSDIKFIHKDILNLPDNKAEQFDVIVLLDVYERLENRDVLIRGLDSILTAEGVLILSISNRSHPLSPGNNELNSNRAFENSSLLGQHLSSKVSNFEFANVWHSNDCIHFVFSRRKLKSAQRFDEQFETTSQKTQRVQQHLNRRVMPEGILLPIVGDQTICIIAPQANQYSETFIRSHAECLPVTVRFLHGSAYDFIRDDGNPLYKPGNLATRVTRRLLRSGLHLRIDHFKRKAFVRFLREARINAILAEYGPMSASIVEECVAANMPLIVHFHGYDAYSHSAIQENSSQYEKMFRYCAGIVCGTLHMQKQLISLGAQPEKIHINPCGVDLSLFQGAHPDEAEPLFVAVGRFVDKKAPYLTLLAFEKVLRSVPESRFVMVGDGPLLEACRQLAASLGINKSVDLPGPLAPASVSSLLRKARAFVQHSVQTSYGDSEGTGITILEAGASGLPVVSTRHMGIAETVRHEQTGFLVEEGDIEMMAQYMLKLARDPALAASMGSVAREHIRSNYSMEKSIDQLWTIIENAIKIHRG